MRISGCVRRRNPGLCTLCCDTLVDMLGSAADTSIVPCVDGFACTLDSPRAAYRLDDLDETGGSVTVCGGGPTGIEAAVAESHLALRISLISRTVQPP
jgi:NADH dehydrogenase